MSAMSAERSLSPKDIVSCGLCIGCGACGGMLNAGNALRFDQYGQYKPRRDAPGYGRRTDRFARTCPFSPFAMNEDEIAQDRFPDARQMDEHIGAFEAAFVGYVAEGEFRGLGSSGGMVSWVAAELLRCGMVDGVAHVGGVDGAGHPYFDYRISRAVADVRAGAKSRYYPVELSGVLDEIRTVPGRYAIVGIPCFIKAINLARAEEPVLAERIVHTLGLFCGHMKSARFVESLAWQMAAGTDEVEKVDYRVKDPRRPANWYTAEIGLIDGRTRRKDWWHLSDGDWGAGFFQNSACNFCDDVVAETADIAFGDAWVEPYSSDGRGTNVVVIRSLILNELIQEAARKDRLNLTEVDADLVRRTQAAGFRQRREGLAYRLTWARAGVSPRKRVRPSTAIPFRRKLTYRCRAAISWWSHRIFYIARTLERPRLYVQWARFALYVYHALAYSRGSMGALADRLASLFPSRRDTAL